MTWDRTRIALVALAMISAIARGEKPRKGDARRTTPLEDFFIDYGKQDRAPGEFVERVFIPALPAAAKPARASGATA